MKYQVSFSMLEIYMEQVADLLSTKKKAGGLKIRQDASAGKQIPQSIVGCVQC